MAAPKQVWGICVIPVMLADTRVSLAHTRLHQRLEHKDNNGLPKDFLQSHHCESWNDSFKGPGDLDYSLEGPLGNNHTQHQWLPEDLKQGDLGTYILPLTRHRAT